MALVKCTTCRVYLVHAKDHIRTHEAKYHEYNSAKYSPHQHKPLSENERHEIALKGEERIGKQLFIGYQYPIEKQLVAVENQ